MLATGALVASLLAVGASPAAAAAIDDESKPSDPAQFSACVGAATQDAGFTDTGGLGAEAAIDCLAYYGITVGKTADTFDPNSNVTRSQMALFLYRAAGLMGVDLMGGDMMASFGDIADQGPDRSNAITALARNGILEGRGGMGNFYPDADITRAEMAVALVALLDHTPGAPVHKDKQSGLYELGADADTAEPPGNWFADARASTPRHVDNAISAAYELGVTTGYSDHTFRPDATVPRKNMASFITRALGHSNLRPEGLTAQNVNGTITVSVRDADFAPVANQAVDAASVAAADESLAFSSSGACTGRVESISGGATKCEIDNADPVTRTDGNISLNSLGADDIGKGLIVWVFHGDVGDKFTAGDAAFEVSVPPMADPGKPPVSAVVSNDLAEGATRARFGATVTVTVQLKDGDAGAGDDAGPGTVGGDDGVEYTVVISERAKADGTDPTDFDGLTNQRTIKVKVADDGSATFTLSAVDGNPSAVNNRVLVSYVVSGGDFSGATPPGPNLDPAATQDGGVIFSDEASVVTNLAVEVAPFQDAPGGTAKAGSSATVTVTDQFGKPVNNVGITLSSTIDTSVFPTSERFTGRDGRVRIGYTYVGANSLETITATYTPGTGDPVTDTANAFWVIAWEKDDTNNGAQDAAAVLNADVDANQVVIETGSNQPKSVMYDSGDFFTVNGDPSSMADFEAELSKVLAAKQKAEADGGTFGGTLTLAWQSYDHEDSADIAAFTLAATLPS